MVAQPMLQTQPFLAPAQMPGVMASGQANVYYPRFGDAACSDVFCKADTGRYRKPVMERALGPSAQTTVDLADPKLSPFQKLALRPIRWYQLRTRKKKTASGKLGYTKAGQKISSRCIYHPSCSEYTAAAIAKHGVFSGIWKGAWHILRCNPFYPLINQHGFFTGMSLHVKSMMSRLFGCIGLSVFKKARQQVAKAVDDYYGAGPTRKKIIDKP